MTSEEVCAFAGHARKDISAAINLLHQPEWRLLTAANICHDLVDFDYWSRARPGNRGRNVVLERELNAGFGIHANKLDWLAHIVARVRGELSKLINEDSAQRSQGPFPLFEQLDRSPLGPPPDPGRLEEALPHLSDACFGGIHSRVQMSAGRLWGLDVSGTERDVVMQQVGPLRMVRELDERDDAPRGDYLVALCGLCGIDPDSVNVVPAPFLRQPPPTPDPPSDPLAGQGGGDVVKFDRTRRSPGHGGTRRPRRR